MTCRPCCLFWVELLGLLKRLLFPQLLLSLLSAFPLVLEFPVQFGPYGKQFQANSGLPALEGNVGALGLLFPLPPSREPSPRGGGGKFHIWAAQNTGMR